METPPTPLIAGFVQRLLQRWPDLPMVYSRAEEASAYAVQVATELGLHCYDPQQDRLRIS
ncbi:hypothetical protein GCM10009850_102500 [Nonomuraea monospora]|uniref:Uncharacterized protein n=1 Tax=Nonomuraea monospora TaxID=568818 RepID=A0ABN3CZ87_9ACTN